MCMCKNAVMFLPTLGPVHLHFYFFVSFSSIFNSWMNKTSTLPIHLRCSNNCFLFLSFIGSRMQFTAPLLFHSFIRPSLFTLGRSVPPNSHGMVPPSPPPRVGGRPQFDHKTLWMPRLFLNCWDCNMPPHMATQYDLLHARTPAFQQQRHSGTATQCDCIQLQHGVAQFRF